MAEFDIVIVGLGIIGAAALERLAARGLRVLGIERFVPGHDRGSSHGETRVIRLGYFEHPSYVPLLRQAYPMWRDVESRFGKELLKITGILEVGAPDSTLVRGTLESSRTHDLAHELLDATQLMRRYPAFRVPSHFVGVYQPDGGYLEAELAIEAHLAIAAAAGAEIRTNTTVLAIEDDHSGVRVVTANGAISAKSVIVAAGAWLKDLLPDLPVPLRVTRQVLGWFAPEQPALFRPENFPVFLLESRHGIHYGFPARGDGGVKVAKHHHFDETVDPDNYDRSISAVDEAAIRNALADHLPAANGPLLAAKTCLYTMTPDGDFIIDQLPGNPRVIVASPCSGHGFKFAPVIGEILADLATDGATPHDISRFRLSRFG